MKGLLFDLVVMCISLLCATIILNFVGENDKLMWLVAGSLFGRAAMVVSRDYMSNTEKINNEV